MEQFKMTGAEDTICAISTPYGTGGIAVVRISGPDSIAIADSGWKGTRLSEAKSHSAHLGKIISTSGELLDEGLATVFRAPASFTGEDVVEISIHGSRWIQREMIADLVRRGARVAEPGEFTKRAFLNGKLDLAQAEGVADLIASSSRAAHDMAISQTRGHFSREFDSLRDRLIEFASLLELELDFSEEEVEFADRERLLQLAQSITARLKQLAASYSTGSAIKEGVPVVIAGIPNAGKSSVLNLLLSDEKAIVSDIPGTTRDTIEELIEIDGILFRFIDTAGLRTTDDRIEVLGIERARLKMRQAKIVLWVFDPTVPPQSQITEISAFHDDSPDTKIILLINKSDLFSAPPTHSDLNIEFGMHEIAKTIHFSAVTSEGLRQLIQALRETILNGHNPGNEAIITNARHYESILRGIESLTRAEEGIRTGTSADFISQDVRESIHHLSAITGSITTPTLLHSIFSRFCIGK